MNGDNATVIRATPEVRLKLNKTYSIVVRSSKAVAIGHTWQRPSSRPAIVAIGYTYTRRVANG